MKLLIAVDSPISTDVLVGAVGVRPWPNGTTAHVLSVVAVLSGNTKQAILQEAQDGPPS